MSILLNRRQFATGAVASTLAPGLSSPTLAQGRKSYRGPNVILIRYGGGVRRRETIDEGTSYSPYLLNVLVPRGVLYRDMRISSMDGVVTSHAQGTLYILTGRYDHYADIEGQFLSERFEPKAPTVFEYLRKVYDVPAHQALIVNGEDRVSEDFLTFSEHHRYGVQYRSSTLSLHGFKQQVIRRKLAAGNLTSSAAAKLGEQLKELEARNYRGEDTGKQPREIIRFWDRWLKHYGDTGLVNPRGDRLLTELAIRAIGDLKPRLMMVNYQDPDYVHWGNLSHYTRAISVIDDGIRQIVTAVQASEFYRGNTVFVIVPDCGRDTNPLMSVDCQHHFNSRSAHEIWALVFGAGVPKGQIVDRPVNQIQVAATIGGVMGMATRIAEGSVLEEVFG